MVFLQTFWHPLQNLADQVLPVVWKVMRGTANTEPGWVHTVTGDRFNRVINLLTVGEHIEYWGHTAGILNCCTDIKQVVIDTEQFRHHHTDTLCTLWHLNTGQLLNTHHIRHVLRTTTEVVDTVGIRNE